MGSDGRHGGHAAAWIPAARRGLQDAYAGAEALQLAIPGAELVRELGRHRREPVPAGRQGRLRPAGARAMPDGRGVCRGLRDRQRPHADAMDLALLTRLRKGGILRLELGDVTDAGLLCRRPGKTTKPLLFEWKRRRRSAHSASNRACDARCCARGSARTRNTSRAAPTRTGSTPCSSGSWLRRRRPSACISVGRQR
jgi:hypothetical protein